MLAFLRYDLLLQRSQRLLGPVVSVGRGVSCPRLQFRWSHTSWPPHRHRRLQLAETLLKVSPEVLIRATSDRAVLREYKKNVFQILELDLPKDIPDKFPCFKTYQRCMASFVVEETIATMISGLSERMNEWKKEKKERIGEGVRIRIDEEQYGFYTCFTLQPLTKYHRKELKAGTVIALHPRDNKLSATKVIFGVIQYGSLKSIKLPQCLQPDSKPGQKRPPPVYGDKISFFIFGKASIDVYEDDAVEIYLVCSILNFQRQFAACWNLSDEKSGLERAIVGMKEQSQEEEHPSLHAKYETSQQTLDVDVPQLNETQQEAADAFLYGTARNLHVVQGPPGTGKTTMTCAIICRYIMESSVEQSDRKLLVCAPTNKSIVVLARKVLKCIERESSLLAVLIGDKSELLSDSHDLESHFVYTYSSHVREQLKRMISKFLKKGNIREFKEKTQNLFDTMKRRLPTTQLENLASSRQEVLDLFEICKEEDPKAANRRSRFDEDMKGVLQAFMNEFMSLNEETIVKDLLGSAHVVFCTLSTAGSLPVQRLGDIDSLIIDEASACTEAETMIPLQFRPERLLIVGDPNQLPPTIMSTDAIKRGFARSLQERLMMRNDYPFSMLNVQYRMAPAISSWPVAHFYEAKVVDGENVRNMGYGSNASLMLQGQPYIWVNVKGQENKNKKGSTYNEREGEAVVSLLLDFKKKYNLSDEGMSNPHRIRIITFYKAQEDTLRQRLKEYHLGVLVSTVDAAQGSEADLVVLSFVRGTSGQMGFLKDIRRLNVALTRARYQLVCVGNLNAIASLAKIDGNLELRDMARDALERADIVEAPSALPRPPPAIKRRTMEIKTKARTKSKKAKTKQEKRRKGK